MVGDWSITDIAKTVTDVATEASTIAVTSAVSPLAAAALVGGKLYDALSSEEVAKLKDVKSVDSTGSVLEQAKAASDKLRLEALSKTTPTIPENEALSIKVSGEIAGTISGAVKDVFKTEKSAVQPPKNEPSHIDLPPIFSQGRALSDVPKEGAAAAPDIKPTEKRMDSGILPSIIGTSNESPKIGATAGRSPDYTSPQQSGRVTEQTASVVQDRKSSDTGTASGDNKGQSDSQAGKSGAQPIKSDWQPIKNDSQPTKNDSQPTKNDSQSVKNDAQADTRNTVSTNTNIRNDVPKTDDRSNAPVAADNGRGYEQGTQRVSGDPDPAGINRDSGKRAPAQKADENTSPTDQHSSQKNVVSGTASTSGPGESFNGSPHNDAAPRNSSPASDTRQPGGDSGLPRMLSKDTGEVDAKTSARAAKTEQSASDVRPTKPETAGGGLGTAAILPQIISRENVIGDKGIGCDYKDMVAGAKSHKPPEATNLSSTGSQMANGFAAAALARDKPNAGEPKATTNNPVLTRLAEQNTQGAPAPAGVPRLQDVTARVGDQNKSSSQPGERVAAGAITASTEAAAQFVGSTKPGVITEAGRSPGSVLPTQGLPALAGSPDAPASTSMLLKIPEGLSKTVGDSFMSPANRNTTTMLQQPIDRSNLPIGISPSLDKTAATQPSLGRNPVFEGYSAYPGNKHTPVFSGKETNLTQMFDRTLNRQQETITGVFTTPGRIVRPVNADGTPFTVLSPKTIEVLRTTAELRSATAELKSSAPTVVPPSLPGNVDRATSQRVHGVVVPSDNVIHNLRTAGIPSPIHPTAQIHSLSTLRPSETPLAKNALSPTGMLHVEALLVRNGHKISTLTPATIQTIHGIHTLTPSLAQTLSGRHGTFVTQMTARGEILPGTSHGATKAEPGTVHTQHTQRTEMTDKTAPGNREVRLPGDKTPIGRDVRIGLPVLILNGDRKGAIATRGTQPGDKSAGVVGDKVQSGIKPTAVIGDKTQPGGKTPIGEKAQPGGKAPIGDKKQPGEKDGKIVRPIVDLTFLGGQRVIETGKGTKPFIARRIDEKVTPGVRLPDKDVHLPEKDISKWLEEKLKNNDRKIPNSKDNKTTDGKVVEGKFVRQIDKSAGRITDNSTWQGDNVRERRLKYFVKRGDTLESIAANKLGDRRFATLLLTINRDNMNTDLQSGKQVHTLKEGAVLVLPTLSELRLHREVFFGSKQGTQTSEIKEDKKPGEKQEEREPQESFKWKDEDDESDKREVGNFLKRLRIAGNRRPVSLGVMTGSTNSNRREYHVRLGDTLRSICLRVIGDAGLWPLLARVNNMPETTNGNGQPSIHLKRGDVIQLPNEDEVEYYRFLKSLEQRCIAERTTSGATPPPQPLAPISVSIDQLGNHCRMVAAERFGANFDSNTRLQTSLLGGWTTIACYETRLGQSSRFVYQKDGTQLQYKLDLPAKVIREMAAEDFKRNYNGYLATFIQAESRFQTSSVGNFLMQSPGPSAAVM